MFKLFKYLAPFFVSILAVIGFLFIQALSDLALPDYTSHIVNIGIQQRGIENAVPQIIRRREFNKVLLMVPAAERPLVERSYAELDRAKLSAAALERYEKSYPLLKKETLERLNTRDPKTIRQLNRVLGKAVLLVSGIEQAGMAGLAASLNRAPAQLQAQLGKITDPFIILAKLPESQLKAIRAKADAQLQNLPQSMITQMAVNYIYQEYRSVRVDTNQLQSHYILNAGMKMLLIALVSAVTSIIVGLLAARIAAGLSRNLRNRIFQKVTDFSIAEFDQFSTASLITRSTNDIQQIQMLMVLLLRIVFYAPLLGIGGIIKVVQTNMAMDWVIGVAIGAILLLVVVLFGLVIPKFKRVQKLIDHLNLVTREFLTGILVIRAFNNQKHEEQKFDAVNQDLTRTNLMINRLMSLMMPMMMLIMNGITLLIVWVGAHQIDLGKMQVGSMMAFIQYTMQIIMAFLMLSMISIMLPRALVSAQRVTEVLETDLSIKNPKKRKRVSKECQGKLEFRDVSFRYPGAEEAALSHISFTAKPGETTALIGSTGSGKTTLANLILRFYDVSDGAILIDGVDLRELDLHDLREKVGYVPQRSILFTGTIESNIQYGKKVAGEAELRRSATTAQAIEFINELPEGFQTGIAQGGTNVSGGQKQRLAIARALVKQARIYIFDDSFSALDYRTDAALRRALKTEIKDSTLLVIAQRISSIKHADQIIVLDEGRTVGMGTHRELLQTCEVYQQIARSQLSQEELEA